MSHPPHTARSSAVFLLNKVLGEQRLMAELLASPAVQKLPAPERARAQRLASQTLRQLERADRVLAHHLRKPPPLAVMNVLRLGATEICTGGDAHGVVNECVGIISRHKTGQHLKGLVNAVLRKVAETGPQDWALLRVPRLPKWLRKPLVQAWGAPEIAAIEAAHLNGAPLDITAKADAATWAETLGGSCCPPAAFACNRACRFQNCRALTVALGGCKTPPPPCLRSCCAPNPANAYWICARHRAGKRCRWPQPAPM